MPTLIKDIQTGLAITRFPVKRNDTAPNFTGQLIDADGTAKDLTGASVQLNLANDAGLRVAGACTITDAATGKISYSWGVSDLDTAGDFELEIEVTDAASAVTTYPNDRWIFVPIAADLDSLDPLSPSGLVNISGIVGGADKQVQYNKNSAFAGDSGLVWDYDENSLCVQGKAGQTEPFQKILDSSGDTMISFLDEAIVFLGEGNTPTGTPVDGGFFWTESDSLWFKDSAGVTTDLLNQVPAAHALGGASHTASTLAALNLLVSDATLDDQTASRPPQSHALGGAAHSASTLAALNLLVSDATLDDTGTSRPPLSHDIVSSHSASGLTTGHVLTATSPTTIAFQAAAAGAPGGADTAVQFNNAGAFGGDASNFGWDNTAKGLSVGRSSPFTFPVVGRLSAKGTAIFEPQSTSDRAIHINGTSGQTQNLFTTWVFTYGNSFAIGPTAGSLSFNNYATNAHLSIGQRLEQGMVAQVDANYLNGYDPIVSGATFARILRRALTSASNNGKTFTSYEATEHVNLGAGHTADIRAIVSKPNPNANGSFSVVNAFQATYQPTLTSGGTIANLGSFVSAGTAFIAAGSTITDFRHFWATEPAGAVSGTITNQYGLKVSPMTKATNNWAIHTETGHVHLNAGNDANTEFKVGNGKTGFFGATPVAKPTVTGSRAGNAALASLLTELASLGLVTDSTSA